MTPPLFLGLDLSTQQLKLIIVSDELTSVYQSAVNFDNDLPHYGTTNGTLQGPGNGEVTAPVAMWLEAMDLLMQKMEADGVDPNAIVAISGAGQQHGSIYWSHHAPRALASLNPERSLKEQLFPVAFSIENCPTWQDSSTTEDCKRLEATAGSAEDLADLTGSRAYERFTGNQISKIRRLRPDCYVATDRISLVSSLMSSVFLGKIAPIEVSDASGMNLMNVISCRWEDKLLELCGGPDLRQKLGPDPVAGGTALGHIHRWWVERWGFNPECIIAPFTGDNPATVAALSAPGDAILSLGTSTTFLLSVPASGKPPKRFTTSHLLSHPTVVHGHIAMLCYKNGALAREQLRDQFANESWDRFNKLVESRPPGNNGYVGMYFPHPEIIPPNVTGEYFFKSAGSGNTSSPIPIPAKNFPADAHPRAILESQLLSIKSRVKAILPDSPFPLQRLILTGGSSMNQTVRQVAADILNMKVYVSGTKEAAALGGAVLARYTWRRERSGNSNGTLEEMMRGMVPGLQCVAVPSEKISQVYDELVDVYTTCEESIVRRFSCHSPA